MSLAMSPNWPKGSLCAVSLRPRLGAARRMQVAIVVENRRQPDGSEPRQCPGSEPGLVFGDHLVLVEGELRGVWSTQITKLKWLKEK